MSRALVLGATGHLGNAIVRELLARGFAVTALRRGLTDEENLADLEVTHVRGDAGDAAFLARVAAGHDLLVDAASPYWTSIGDVRGHADAATARAESILAAARGARVVHISAFVTRVPVRGFHARAADRLHPYFAAKRAGEAAFLAGGAAVVNPTYCLGPYEARPRSVCLLPKLARGELAMLPDRLINVIDVRDVARGVAALAGAEVREPVLLAGHNLSLAALSELVSELYGRPTRKPRGSLGLGIAAGWFAELGAKLLPLPPPSPLLPLLLLERHVPLSPSAVQRELGAVARPLSDTLRDALRWYRQLGHC